MASALATKQLATTYLDCLKQLSVTDSNPNNTVFDCGKGTTLTVNAPLPNVFCLSIRQSCTAANDFPPRDLDSTREPLELDSNKKSWTWKQGDVHLTIEAGKGFTLTRYGTVAIQSAANAIMCSDRGISLQLNTVAMGSAATWPMPAAQLQGAVACCGLYGGVGAITADGIVCTPQDEQGITHICTHSTSIDILLVAGTPLETTNQISLLVGRVVPPSIWTYGLGLSTTVGSSASFEQAQSLRALGIAIDVILPDETLALDAHGRFALMTHTAADTRTDTPATNNALEDMALSKHLSAYRQAKYKIVPRIKASLAQADTINAEWKSRNWTFKATDGTSLPNIELPNVVAQVNERLESVFKHGIDASQLAIEPDLRTNKKLFGAWKRTVYASSMRWHGEGADRRTITFTDTTLPTKAGLLGVTIEADCSSFEGINIWLQTMGTACHSGTVLMASLLKIENASDAILLRLAPLAALLPICWLSSAQRILDASPEVHAAWKLWSNYRLKLLPYVAGVIEEASRNGLPALRSMRLSFPRDQLAGKHYAHQYMLGPSLLVAPVLHAEAETTVWLPAGEKWYHLPTGTKFEGGQAITIPVAQDAVAVFGREGHVLCIGPDVPGAPSINTIKPVTDAWLFGLPSSDPCVTGIRVKVMQMQGNAYIKGLEGTKVISTSDYTVSRRGAEVKIVKRR